MLGVIRPQIFDIYCLDYHNARSRHGEVQVIHEAGKAPNYSSDLLGISMNELGKVTKSQKYYSMRLR